jgi:iron complex outermembrane receptor protein
MRLNSISAYAASSIAIGFAALSVPAFAQSTGSIDFEKEIVVTGTRGTVQAVAGISAPDTSKAKAVLTQENIAHQNPGQSILDTINQVPGVSFQNNDAYGSSGGTLSIRGFDSTRISLTFDGVPTNDSGSYSIFSNQQLDPELIEQVNVNLGTTDVDSPTASAVGGTVNYRTITPSHDFGAMLSGSAGQFSFMRIFAKVETGDLTESGTRAFFALSRATNDLPYNGYGKINKQQYNVKLYQPLGGGDFISIAAHYNQNKNNNFGSMPLRLDPTRTVGTGSGNRFPITEAERNYTINFPCLTTASRAGLADVANTCGTDFDRRYNPSNTGNIRINSRFTLADGLVLTVDPSFQYVKAAGSTSAVTAQEAALRDINPSGGTATTAVCRTTPSSATNTCVAGYLGGTPYAGRDLNGDGDLLDTVTIWAPSVTQTRRIGVIAGLRWDMNDTNTIRLSYSFDRARHRQTGEIGRVTETGEPVNLFPVDNPTLDGNGYALQKRDRLSFAILHQFSAEYRGEFIDSKLVVNAGVRMPFFKRNLTNYCSTSSAGGFVECFGQGNPLNATYATLNPTIQGPQQRIFNFKKLLPSLGFIYHIDDSASVFANFSQGLSVPGTDSLYNAFFFAPGTAGTKPASETTNNFDGGVRYRSGKIQAQLSGFYNQYRNRLASAYDPILDQSVYRNLGNVRKYGLDGSVAFSPIPEVSLYVFGSVIKSEIQNDLVIGENTDGTSIYAATTGKHEAGSPTYSFGGTIRASLGPVDIGLTAKRTGPRYIYDTNEATYTGSFIPVGAKTSTGTAPVAPVAPVKIYDTQTPAYWLVNLDARVNLSFLGLNDKTFLQLNVYNLFDQLYVGGFSGNLIQTNTYSKTTGLSAYGASGFAQVGAPRTISGTVVFAF